MPAVKQKKSVLSGIKVKVRTGPVWAGPCGEGPQGGVTQSLLGRYLTCKERFRALVVEGLRPHERFSPPTDFGTMWHACEEAHAHSDSGYVWQDHLDECVAGFRKRFPMEVQPILHWYSVCRELFPLYVEHWAKHDDVRNRTPLLAEQTFDVPYLLPSGRTVRLRGKWDSVDLVKDGKRSAVWIQENKTKSAIDRAKIERQLRFDLQTMLYVVALEAHVKQLLEKRAYVQPGMLHKIAGVRYNVVRRSAHKSTESMLKKLEEDRADGRINEWFDRWNVEVGARDVEVFRRQCLDPELENLCDDYEWWSWCKIGTPTDPFDYAERQTMFPRHILRHARRPFGVYDVLAEGGASDLDAWLATGSEAGLTHVTNLFPELS